MLVCEACRSRLTEPSWPRCPRCHHPRGTGRAEADDCLHCRPWPAALTAARCAVVLRAPATDLVHALKYGGWSGLARPLGDRMARVARSDPSVSVRGPAGVVVPVPTTSSRLRARGYNQAGLLADRVGARLGLPVGDALERVRGDVSQTALTPEERRSNVRGAFRCSRPVRGASVLLVDDVLTTGATAGEAAATLVAAGADRVVLVAFARALPGGGGLRDGSAGLAA